MAEFRKANLSVERDQQYVIDLVSSFSQESSNPRLLPKEIRDTLVANLQKFPTTLVYFAENQGIPIGIAVCFLSFSTFENTPVLNIHDFYIKKEHQGTGLEKQFLDYVEVQAKNNGCCKVTLEVFQKNERANLFFEGSGYSGGQNDTEDNIQYFLQKYLNKK